MEPYKLFLDDLRLPKDCLHYMKDRVYDVNIYADKDWIIVRNKRDFIKKIKNEGMPEIISFDNDLGDEQGEGYECAAFVVEQCLDKNLPFPTSVVHSLNPVASENIQSLITNFKKFQDEESTLGRGQ